MNQELLKPFSIGFDILDLKDILKQYEIKPILANAVIRFYAGKRCDLRK